MKLELSIQTSDPVHKQIENFLRREITSGQLRAGTRLPPTADLARQWGVDFKAIQNAMARLVSEGLISRKPRRGTIVNAKNTRQTIGLLVGADLMNECHHFDRALYKALTHEIFSAYRRVLRPLLYDGLNTVFDEPTENNKHRQTRLANDLRDKYLNGVIEISLASKIHAIGKKNNLPYACYRSRQNEADVIIDYRQFTRELICYLHKRDARRIMYLRLKNDSRADLDGMAEAVHVLQMPEPEIFQWAEKWKNGAELERMVFAQTLRLIEKWRQSGQWPQALIIADDIAACGAAKAFLSAGVHVPERLILACLANQGVELYYGMPVIAYEISPQRIAHELLAVLQRRMKNAAMPVLPIKIGGKIMEKR